MPHRNNVDHDTKREGDGQPAMDLPNQVVPGQRHLPAASHKFSVERGRFVNEIAETERGTIGRHPSRIGRALRFKALTKGRLFAALAPPGLGSCKPQFARVAMSVQPDTWIRHMAQTQDMISPFVETQKREGVISYGLSSYGYDARVADEFRLFTNVDSAIVDPKDFREESFVTRRGPVAIIPPNSFALAHTVEYFRIPRDILVICLGKSTYARCGIIVNVTPLEPEWEGPGHDRNQQHHAAARENPRQ